MRWVSVLGTSLVLALVACTGDPPDPAAPGDPAPVADPAAPPGADPGDRPPTLADLLGVGGTPEEVARGIRATEATRQEFIRDCMAEHGFEYVPHVTGGDLVNLTGLPTHLPEADFRRQYGYGIATGFESALRLQPDEPTVDPNLAITAAMSPAEHAAYLRTLHGDDPTAAEPGGCSGEATTATDTTAIVIEEFGDHLADLQARVDADTRVVAAEREWVDCLAAAGYAYPDEVEIRREVTRRMNPLLESLAGEEVPEGVVDLYRGISLTPEQQDQLTSVRGFELAVAAADQDCRDQVGVDRIRREVRDEQEAGFVAEHRDRLRELFPAAGL